MPSTYTTNLGIELPADGELDGVWGDVVNENMDILDRAINGSIALSLTGTSSTLTTSDGALSDGQYKLLVLGGSPSGTHTITIAPNDAQKIYFVRNTTAQSVVFTQGSGGNVTIATGDSAIIYSDGAGAGAAVVNITNDFAMSSVKITGGTIDGTVIGGTSAAAVTGTTITGTSFVSSGDMTFGDNDKAIFGAGSDLQIYHDGTNSYIDDQGTGRIIIKGNDDVRIRSGADEEMIVASSNGAVTLYHDSLPKFTTNATGVGVTGNATFADNGKAIFGAGSDLQIYHDGVNNWVDAVSGVMLVRGSRVDLRGANDELLLVGNQNGAVSLYYDNAAKLATTATGVTVTGDVGATTGTFTTVTSGLGAVGTPSITFTGDTNTGIWSPAADTIAFSEGGTEAMRIDSAGNVGIGTTSPTERLQVGTTASNYIAIAKDGVTSSGIKIIRSGTLDGLLEVDDLERLNIGIDQSGTLGTGVIRFLVGSTERVRIDTAGNVGIGTSVPSDYNASADNLVVGTTSGNNGITIAAGTASQGSLFFADGTATAAEEAAGYLLYVHTDDSMRIGTANTERMRITSAGNVGIGTTAPNATLEVLRSSEGEYLRVGGSVATARSLTFTSSTAGASAGALHTINAASTEGVIALATASTERMRITVTGNVGIGTTSPIEKLDVRGAVFVGNVASGINYDGMILDYNTSTREARLAVGATSGGSSFFTFTTSNAGVEGERMRITSAGNVGIGTTSPASKLSVSGSTSSTLTDFTGAGDSFSLLVSSGDAATVNSPMYSLDMSRSGSSNAKIDFNRGSGATNGFLTFSTTANERMRITSAGNVGIGNTAPITPLHVTGATVTTGVVYKNQSAQNVESAAATLTIAELLTGIIEYTGALATLTMPTGTDIEGGVPATFPTNMSFDFSVINTGAGVVTLGTATGLTLVGGMTVAAAASGLFRARKTALNTYTIYRLA
jgi:hypothetical protein